MCTGYTLPVFFQKCSYADLPLQWSLSCTWNSAPPAPLQHTEDSNALSSGFRHCCWKTDPQFVSPLQAIFAPRLVWDFFPFVFCSLTIICFYVDLFLFLPHCFINQRICISLQFWKILRHWPFFLVLSPHHSSLSFYFLIQNSISNQCRLEFLILSSVFQSLPPYFSSSYFFLVHLG